MNIAPLTVVVLAASTLILAGCGGSGGTRDEQGGGAEVVEGGSSASDGSGGSGVSTSGLSGGSSWTGNALDDPNSLLSTRTLYFDFDQSTIRDEFFSVLSAHATYLSANPQVRMTIEGHADERGSREYNIGLGERRAKSVQRFLEAEGVDPLQLSTVSYGEERPEAFGSDEESWALNRRAVLAY